MNTNTAQRLLQENTSGIEASDQAQALPILKKKTVNLRLNQIIRNPENREINLEKVRELTESIQLVGLLHDPAVKPIGDDMYMLVSGEHRYRAFEQLARMDPSYNHITCKIVNQDDLHTELALLDGNLKSNGLSPYEEIMAIGRREEILGELKVPGTKRDVIAKEIGQKPTQIGKKLKIYKKAIPEVHQELKYNRITIERAAELAGLDPDQQKQALLPSPTTQKQQKSDKEIYLSLLNRTYRVLGELSDFYYDHKQFQTPSLSKVLGDTDTIKRKIRVCLYTLQSIDEEIENEN